ncbi:MAG: hypothetical protein Q7V63_08900 [Gammaproteobacteria bacterium]|nr:hypothetical protein [Gammaproteobacteria bacterium]
MKKKSRTEEDVLLKDATLSAGGYGTEPTASVRDVAITAAPGYLDKPWKKNSCIGLVALAVAAAIGGCVYGFTRIPPMPDSRIEVDGLPIDGMEMNSSGTYPYKHLFINTFGLPHLDSAVPNTATIATEILIRDNPDHSTTCTIDHIEFTAGQPFSDTHTLTGTRIEVLPKLIAPFFLECKGDEAELEVIVSANIVICEARPVPFERHDGSEVQVFNCNLGSVEYSAARGTMLFFTGSDNRFLKERPVSY